MKTIRIKVYKFNELTDKSKQVAIHDYRAKGWVDTENVWYDTKSHAAEVGLLIDSLDGSRPNEGSFQWDACQCAHKIIDNHGEKCDTYKTAAAFLVERDEIVSTAPRDENGDFEDESELDEKLDECESDFLKAILEDYWIIYNREYEDASSDKAIAIALEINEYDFLVTGNF